MGGRDRVLRWRSGRTGQVSRHGLGSGFEVGVEAGFWDADRGHVWGSSWVLGLGQVLGRGSRSGFDVKVRIGFNPETQL
ncbi:hypothetical protein TIFTF001_014917 [Ficus carica]|uniref:Uncharacterized protein n=1 Tax=Ficus carica TaxID=3494 RepID=A0AA88DIJ4_FICCA|nr:hypothetical protein TIFTF001_014917 [Ficus carica]